MITCLPSSREVEEVIGGADGLLAGMRRGTVLVDCTSGDPATAKRIAARLAERGIDYVDAPVSGGVGGAEKGTLTVMVGGDAAVLGRQEQRRQGTAELVVRARDQLQPPLKHHHAHVRHQRHDTDEGGH